MLKQLAPVSILLAVFPEVCHAHGYLFEPPGRSTMWRKGYNTPINYDDNALYSGGFDVQWNQNGGKCGICGDNFQDPQPRENEAGGLYGNGILVASYTQGQVITVNVELTANHRGWMEFRICPNNDVNQIATQTCLDQYLLQRADGGGSRTNVPTGVKDFIYDLQLPAGLTCSQYVVQWKYHAGNNHGCVDPVAQTGCCLGCAAAQEEFYGCADVEILGNGGVPPTTTTGTTMTGTTTTPTTTTAGSGESECLAWGVWTSVPNMHSWCQQNCFHSVPYCPTTHCNDACRQGQQTTTTTPTTTTPTSTAGSGGTGCLAWGVWASVPNMHTWCQQNCAHNPPYCPTSHCNNECRGL